MKPIHTKPDPMKRGLAAKEADSYPGIEMERLLERHLNAPEEQLTPSSGFALSVMEAIVARAAEPPPIPFPWRRVLPGAIAVLCALAAFAVFFVVGRATGTDVRMAFVPPASFTPGEIALGGVVVAIMASAAVVAASFRLAGRSR